MSLRGVPSSISYCKFRRGDAAMVELFWRPCRESLVEPTVPGQIRGVTGVAGPSNRVSVHPWRHARRTKTVVLSLGMQCVMHRVPSMSLHSRLHSPPRVATVPCTIHLTGFTHVPGRKTAEDQAKKGRSTCVSCCETNGQIQVAVKNFLLVFWSL